MNRALRLSVPLLLMAATLGALLPWWAYYHNYDETIQFEARRLLEVGALAAKLTSPSDLAEATEGYLEQDGALSRREGFQRLTRMLRTIQQSQHLDADLALFIRPEWKPDHMVYVAMGAEKSYVGNGLPLNAEAAKAWQTRKATVRAWSDDSETRYLTAYVPVLADEGKLLAMAQVDRVITPALNEVRSRWFLETLISLLFWIGATALGLAAYRRQQGKSVKVIRDAVYAAFPKETPPFAALGGSSAEALASAFLTQTHTLRDSNEKLAKEKKTSEQQRAQLESRFRAVMQQWEAVQTASPARLIAFDVRGMAVWCTEAASHCLGKSPMGEKIAVLLQWTEAHSGEIFDQIFADPSRWSILAGDLPEYWQDSQENYYRVSFQLSSELADEQSRWLFIALESMAKEQEAAGEVAALREELLLTRAFSLFPVPFARLVDRLRESGGDPTDLKITARALGLTALEAELEASGRADHFLSTSAPLAAASLSAQPSGESTSLASEIGWWGEYGRAVARSLGKREPELQMQGTSVRARWDRLQKILEGLRGCLFNAIQHGLEPETERARAGKPLPGQLTVTFETFPAAEGRVWCLARVADDGAGLDPQTLRGHLRTFAIDASQETNHTVLQHLFEKGVSPHTEAGAEWDRETGLWKLSQAVGEVNGTCEIDSSPGQGTTITVVFPLESAPSERVAPTGPALFAAA